MKLKINDHLFHFDNDQIQNFAKGIDANKLIDDGMVKSAVKGMLPMVLMKQKIVVPKGEDSLNFAISHFLAQALQALGDNVITLEATEVKGDDNGKRK